MDDDEGAGYLTDASRQWLEQLFTEWLGLPISLHRFGEQTTMIADGAAVKVVFPYRKYVYCRQSSDLPCSIWDAAEEGWRPPIEDPIPAPGETSLPAPLVLHEKDSCRLRFDLPGLVYWQLARIEEIGRKDLDMHGRFPATASHAWKHGYLHRPIVDEWVEYLRQAIERQWPQLRIRRPNFSVAVSHDIDFPARYAICTPSQWARRLVGAVVARRAFREALDALSNPFGASRRVADTDPFNTFEWLMVQSELRGISGTFYLMTGSTNALYDPGYDPRHPAILSLIRNVIGRGHEIGLHPSYGAFEDAGAIRVEADRLRAIVAEESGRAIMIGGRTHYLRRSQPATQRAFAEAGLTHDAGLGFADCAGFRCATSSRYVAFDPVAGVQLPVVVRPLVAMESSVTHYMGKGVGQDAIDVFLQLKENCRQTGGCFSILWHNSELYSPSLRKTYLTILDT